MENRRLNLEQRRSIVTWSADGNNVRQILILFANKYRRRNPPDKKTVSDLLYKWNHHNTIENRHKGNSGRKRTARSDENIEVISEIIQNDPHLSIPKMSSISGITKYGVWTILKNDLKLHPYKRSEIIKLSEEDKQRRLNFCDDFERVLEAVLEDIWWTDEAHFQESGYTNNQNFRHYSADNPHYAVEKGSYPPKTTFWCAINVRGTFTVNINGNVNGEVYRDIIRNQFVPFLQRTGRLERAWFMQDGARPHTAIATTDLLHEIFGDKVISLRYPERYNGGVSWPPRSPDLTPCDFFWWGTSKDLVFKEPPNNIIEIAQKFEEVARNIPIDQIRKAISIHFDL